MPWIFPTGTASDLLDRVSRGEVEKQYGQLINSTEIEHGSSGTGPTPVPIIGKKNFLKESEKRYYLASSERTNCSCRRRRTGLPVAGMSTELFFGVKNITYFGSNRTILLQNENGPCPLLAVANALLLENKLKGIHGDQGVVTLSQLTALVANLLVEMKDKIVTDANNNSAYHQDQLNSILDILPKLANGLDLNVCFRDVHDFEFTEEISVFDGLGVTLVHGWMLDTQDKITTNTMQAHGCSTYNHLMFKLVEYKGLVESNYKQPESTEVAPESFAVTDNNNNMNAKLIEDGHVLEEFLAETASQLTYMGLLTLHHSLKERQLAVFFRNNHFATVFKYNSQLYLLVTDVGYQDQPNVIWECLDAVDGNTEYVDSNFKPASFVSSNDVNANAASNYATLDFSSLLDLAPATSTRAGTIALPPQPATTGTSNKAVSTERGVSNKHTSTVVGTIALPPAAMVRNDSDLMNRQTGIPQYMSDVHDDFSLAKKLQEEEDYVHNAHASERHAYMPADAFNPDAEFHRLGLSLEEIELIKNEEAYYNSKKGQRHQNPSNTASNMANPMRNNLNNTSKGKDDQWCKMM